MSPLQQEILRIFKEFDTICKKFGLRYYAIGGTCIGAVRHKGFIPWDDDLDVAMPYEDYCKFTEIAGNELKYPFELVNPLIHKGSSLRFNKIHDIKTTFIEPDELGKPYQYKGIYIDIMPVSGLPSGKYKRERHIRLLDTLTRIDSFINRDRDDNDTSAKLICWYLVHFVKPLFPKNFFSARREKAIRKYSVTTSDEVLFVWRSPLRKARYSRIIYPKAYFENCIEVPFEDTLIRIPGEYDAYLSSDFGDYMRLPPEEERIPCHGNSIIDLQKSYLEYVRNFQLDEEKHGKK